MPALIEPELKPWTPAQETETDLDWAPLITIDFAKWDTPGGKQALAHELAAAVHDTGFWVIINPGITQEAMDQQFSLANTFFHLPEEQKNEVQFVPGVACHGYRPPGFVRNTSHRENLEILNLHKFTPSVNIERHTFMKLHEAEFADFQKLVFDAVITKIFILLAIILELPENHFSDMHGFEKESDDHLRFIKYKPRTLEEDQAVNNQWLAGHTGEIPPETSDNKVLMIFPDFGSITLLFPQPIAGLQVQTAENEWKWVKYVKGGIVCNIADLMSLMTKGYLKSAVHRVVRPPPDQAHLERLGMFFFVRPANEVIIKPSSSPVLQREGLWTQEDENCSDEDATTCGEFVQARMQKFDLSRTPQAKENQVVRVKKWEVLNKY
ncbi:Flavonol synthase [Mycena sanguinolenta]|uniref:Flavonol synthase n=1 Tax=Mycena sanguinolenta TaxID=230812 RepID=A0A8H6XLM5_9AGAR|nr:Flavonol synthase [Mycena sanguinolenta]